MVIFVLCQNKDEELSQHILTTNNNIKIYFQGEKEGRNSNFYSNRHEPPITSTVWPLSEYTFTRPTHSQRISTVYPGRKKATIKQLFISTRPRRSPLATVPNEPVNYSDMIPNNFTGTANSASFYQVRLLNNFNF